MGMVIIIMWDLSRQILEIFLNYCDREKMHFSLFMASESGEFDNKNQ